MKCPECDFKNPDTTRFCGECGAELLPKKKASAPHTKTLQTPMKELTRGSTFASRYEIIEELGKGGMGSVYKVFDEKIKEKVALKLLKPEIASDEETIERFSNELRFARKISHRSVCRMYDLSEEEGAHYITMEYVPGEDLKRLIRKVGQLSAGKTIFIAKQVCEGLAEAHRLGVVHRDLKPQNIMVDEEGNSRIMDFGIARSLKTKGITRAGVMIGTPEYMSPEQAEVKEVDQRSDIYSLGSILYEMVTGQVPFEGETALSIAMKHKSQAPQDPKELNSQMPSDLSRLILRCMEKDREKRYQNVEEILSELINIEEGIPTTERVIPKRRPLTTKEITVTFKLQKLFIPALVVIALVVIGMIIWQLLPKKDAAPPELSDKPSLAVMYFENNTGDEGLDHYRKAISDLLITDLAQSKHIMVVRGDRLFNILRQLNLMDAKSYSSEDLREVASRGRATHVLQGNYTKAGENFRINYMLHEASTEELLGSEMVEGKGEESIFSMVDELTRRIKANFKLSPEEIASDMDKEVEEITTSSPEAYKYYSEGRKHHLQGEYRQSISFMEKAIAIDSEFAMAYRSLSVSYGNRGYGAERDKYIKKAFELSDRLSDGERYLIQGNFYDRSEKTYDKAIEAYKKLLELYPDSIWNISLGIVYVNLEEWDKAIERIEILRKNKDESLLTFGNLANAYMHKGMYDEARELSEEYLNNVSNNASARRGLARIYFCQKKYDAAFAEVQKATFLSLGNTDNILMKGHIYVVKEDFIKAEEEYKKVLKARRQTAHLDGREWLGALYLLQGKFETAKDQLKQGMELADKLGETEWKAWFHGYLGYMHLKSGNPEEALEEFNIAWRIAVEEENLSFQRGSLWSKGLVYLEMKSMKEAQRAAKVLKEMIEGGMNKKIMRLYHHLMGMIELKRQNYNKAIEYFKKALPLLPAEWMPGYGHALFIDPLALAYYKKGNLDKAQEEYERIISMTTGRAYFEDIYAKSFYMLGKIYEEKDRKEKAIEHYERFLDLWKDADPGIPEVDDAKKQLASLRKLP